jgi:antitoxin component YwqK of YwqJK toxin-antitoxin module
MRNRTNLKISYCFVAFILSTVLVCNSCQKKKLFLNYYDNTQLKSKGYFIDGKKNGEWLMWYENGEKKARFEYKNDLLTDTAFGYYENGKLMCIRMFSDGKSEGGFLFWYDNGKLKTEGHFTNNQKSGLWKHYNENGELIRQEKF